MGAKLPWLSPWESCQRKLTERVCCVANTTAAEPLSFRKILRVYKTDEGFDYQKGVAGALPGEKHAAGMFYLMGSNPDLCQ